MTRVSIGRTPKATRFNLWPACAGRLMLFLSLLLLPAIASAQFEYTTNFTYITNGPTITTNGSITISGYDGPGGDVAIPCTTNGYPVTGIGDSAFSSNPNIASVVIPNSVSYIGFDPFYGCDSLTNVWIGSSVTNIIEIEIFPSGATTEASIFSGCSSLTTIAVDTNNPAFSSLDGALFDKAQDTLVQVPGGLNGTFVISNSVTTVDGPAFNDCDNLTGVEIGSGVTNLFYLMQFPSGAVGNVSVFSLCPNLTNITVDANNSVYSSFNGVLYSKDGTTLITAPFGLSGNYVVPETVTNIQDSAFANCLNLTAVFFEGNAPSADSPVFEDDNITAYYLPNTTGWDDFANDTGVPVALWLPQMQTATTSPSAQNPFAFTINWAGGQTVVVEACTNIFNPVWLPIQTNMLSSNSVSFCDPQWTNYPGRFYRISSQ